METTKTEKKLLVYVSIFIAITLNIHRIFTVFNPNEESGSLIGIPWMFNLPELIYQTTYQFFVCYFFGYITLKYSYYTTSLNTLGWIKLIVLYLIAFSIVVFIGSISQELLFQNAPNKALYIGGYFVRLLLSFLLMLALVKVLLMYRKQRVKDLENEKLKTAYYNAKLNNLRDQVNPHFLFNSLSNLSTLIREKPAKAQDFISHLSKVFRYSFANDGNQVVNLNTELALLKSNIELYKIRLEDALVVNINMKDTTGKKILHMSLQPLLENAIKHNQVSLNSKLRIDIVQKEDVLIFMNTIKERKFKEPSTGIGLFNLNERYQMLTDKAIEIQKTNDHFIVKLPLI